MVSRVKRLLPRKTKVGHTGTLDPLASGLLVLLVGRATRLSRYVTHLDKTYRATARFGAISDTLDSEGEITPLDAPIPDEDTLRAALPDFTGDVLQIPPMASAIKVGGQRLYDLHRRGVSVEREPRSVRIHALTLIGFDPHEQTATFEVSCSSGTYVRSLIADLATSLHTGAYLTALRRTSVGHLTLDDAVPPEALSPMTLDNHIIPMSEVVSHLPAVAVDEEGEWAVGSGRGLRVEGMVGSFRVERGGELLAVYRGGWRDGAGRGGVVRGVVVALGNFDGVHLGHQAVLRRAVEEGRERGVRVVAATFDPHPRAVLWPGEQPKLLTTLELRREALLRYGADEVWAIRFDEELSKKTPEDFVRDVLLGEIGAEAVVVGENFRFGHRAAGHFEDLERLMRSSGGEAYAVPIRSCGAGERGISSTRIRALISGGEVEGAAQLLGRPYLLRGEVVVGDRRGRAIGFPTANVLPDPALVVPARGVYAGFVYVGKECYAACTNVGVAPTFERRESRVEAYLLDFEGDLYGRVVDVSFVRRIRPEKRFGGVEELKEQIARDVGEARRITNDTF